MIRVITSRRQLRSNSYSPPSNLTAADALLQCIDVKNTKAISDERRSIRTVALTFAIDMPQVLNKSVVIGVALLLAALAFDAGLNVLNTRALYRSADEVNQSNEVLRSLERTLSTAKDAETSQRGFLITGEQRYLEPYHKALGEIEGELRRVEQLTQDNVGQRGRVARLREFVTAKLAELDQTIALRQDLGFEAARQVLATDRGKHAMDAIRTQVLEMQSDEQARLRERAPRARRAYWIAIGSAVVALSVGVGAILVAVALLRRHLFARAESDAVILEQREHLRATLSSIGDAVIVTDNHGKVVFLNRVAQELTGYAQAEATGRDLDSVFNIVNEQTRSPVQNLALRALREGTIVEPANHAVLIAKQGTERLIDDSAAPIRSEDGTTFGAVLVFRDVSAQARLQADLEEADRRKNEFLAVLSHELRNPLAPIRNALEMMRLAGNDPVAVEKARSIMERQLAQMVRLTDDLLDVARITYGTFELRKQRVELAQVLNSAIEASRPLMQAQGHRFRAEIPEQPIYVDADPTRLAQVFSNLLNNSVKYTKPGGDIGVSVTLEGDHAVISVKDSGAGIPAHMLGKVFDMFTQIDRSLERAQGGLGIGLAIVRRLVEMHGGTTEVFSAGDGLGSEFRVRLPVVHAVGAPASDAEQGRSLRPRRVLVVDDNHDSALSLQNLLQLMGNDVRIGHDGLEAVEMAEQYRPDIILLDIGLPRLNGYDACQRIRSQAWGEDIVIAALTGWGQEEDRRRSQEVGFDRHLLKPVDLHALEQLLNAV